MRFEYRAEWGTLTKVVTYGVAVLLIGLPILFMVIDMNIPTVELLIAVVMPPSILVLTAPFMVRGYTVTPDQLIIHRLGWANKFNLVELQEISADANMITGSWRMLGSGGLFGFFGLFRNRQLGTYHAYITDLNKVVVMKFASKTIVVSPHDPHDFIDKVNRMIAGNEV